jgi:hypothetical protein
MGCGHIHAGESAHGDVVAAGRAVIERSRAQGGVIAAGSVVVERLNTAGRIGFAGGVANERDLSICCVEVTDGVA